MAGYRYSSIEDAELLQKIEQYKKEEGYIEHIPRGPAQGLDRRLSKGILAAVKDGRRTSEVVKCLLRLAKVSFHNDKRFAGY